MNTTHEFRREGEELVEIITGDELVDNNNKKVEGRYERKTYYPEKTAREMIKVLERQLKDARINIESREQTIKNNSKELTRVDEAFMRKFRAAIAQTENDKLRTANNNELERIKQIEEQLIKVRAAWPELFE